MLRNFFDDDGGLFGVCMGSADAHITDHRDFDAIDAMIDAQQAFERAMEQAARTKFEDDPSIRLALSSLIGAWRCVVRARAAAGC